QQTMLINEHRLNMADPEARRWLAQQTEAYFFGDGAEKPAGYIPPNV
ncbi:MAG: Fe(2+)-trafficking protein, partial [Burkholderiales bacterium]|nr:Fe(2+)-trafficking protein [Burkholderiales bacterium]